jgi:hypothetical protein
LQRQYQQGKSSKKTYQHKERRYPREENTNRTKEESETHTKTTETETYGGAGGAATLARKARDVTNGAHDTTTRNTASEVVTSLALRARRRARRSPRVTRTVLASSATEGKTTRCTGSALHVADTAIVSTSRAAGTSGSTRTIGLTNRVRVGRTVSAAAETRIGLELTRDTLSARSDRTSSRERARRAFGARTVDLTTTRIKRAIITNRATAVGDTRYFASSTNRHGRVDRNDNNRVQNTIDL